MKPFLAMYLLMAVCTAWGTFHWAKADKWPKWDVPRYVAFALICAAVWPLIFADWFADSAIKDAKDGNKKWEKADDR